MKLKAVPASDDENFQNSSSSKDNLCTSETERMDNDDVNSLLDLSDENEKNLRYVLFIV